MSIKKALCVEDREKYLLLFRRELRAQNFISTIQHLVLHTLIFYRRGLPCDGRNGHFHVVPAHILVARFRKTGIKRDARSIGFSLGGGGRSQFFIHRITHALVGVCSEQCPFAGIVGVQSQPKGELRLLEDARSSRRKSNRYFSLLHRSRRLRMSLRSRWDVRRRRSL